MKSEHFLILYTKINSKWIKDLNVKTRKYKTLRGSCFDLGHWMVYLCFPLRVLYFLVLTFRSLIHFEFIFVYSIRKCSDFILLHVAVQFPQHCLLKRLPLSYCIFLPPLPKIRSHMCMGLFLGFLSCSIGLYFCFCASTILS